MPSSATDERLLEIAASIVSGRSVLWDGIRDLRALEAVCDENAISSLAWAALRDSRAGVPPSFLEWLERESDCEKWVKLGRKKELARVLEMLDARGIHPVLMKGFPLAYQVYASPHLRPSFDIDLMIRRSEVATTLKVLEELGYQLRSPEVNMDAVHEFSVHREDAGGFEHVLDFHWKISNPAFFSDLLSYEEIDAQAVGIPLLGPDARALDFEQALLLACVHRVAHHHNDLRLIWLYDIHLLAGRLGPEAMARFADRASEKRVFSICRSGLLESNRFFGTPLGREWLEDRGEREEVSKAYLVREANWRWRDLIFNLKYRGPFRDRVDYLRSYLFPPAGFMLKKYSARNRAWLPLLYLRRGIEGVWRVIKNR